MRWRHLIIVAMLAGFAPASMPLMVTDKAEAAQTVVKKKKKKKTVVQEQPRVKKNFRAPLPGEPNAGWTDDCLFHYDVYGRLPGWCDANGRGFRRWD